MAATKTLIALTVIVTLVITSPTATSSVTCGQVFSAMSPCLAYLRSGGACPPACCNGVRGLAMAAGTTPDRRMACNCLKTAASNAGGGLNYGLAAGLPRTCGVSIPYKISPSTDCTKVV